MACKLDSFRNWPGATSKSGAGPEAALKAAGYKSLRLHRMQQCPWIFSFSIILGPALFLHSIFWPAFPGAVLPHLLPSFLSLYKPLTLYMDVSEQNQWRISLTIYKKPLSLLFKFPFQLITLVDWGQDAFWKVLGMPDTPCKGPGTPWTVLLWFRMNNFFLPTSLVPASFIWEFAFGRGEECQLPGTQRLLVLLLTTWRSPSWPIAVDHRSSPWGCGWHVLAVLSVSDELGINCAVWDSYFMGNLLQELSMCLCLRLVTTCKPAMFVSHACFGD